MASVFQSLVNAVSGEWWSYFVIFGVAMVDAFFPLVPSETVLITGGMLARTGDLELGLVILAAPRARSPATTSASVSGPRPESGP